MDIFVNELSLHGQFNSVAEFVPTIKTMLSCKQLVEQYAYRVYCLRSIAQRPTTTNLTFRQTVMQMQTKERDIVRVIASWIDKHGPFLDDNWIRDPNIWFEFEKDIVTDTTLGEVAFRIQNNLESAIISFQPSAFLQRQVSVICKKAENEDEVLNIPNFWNHDDLKQHCLTAKPPINSWVDLLTDLQIQCRNLTFLDSLLLPLAGEPFNLSIANRVAHLLSVLNTLRSCFDEQGAMNSAGFSILQDNFHGDKALFSDESDTNKVRFKAEMTFTKANGDLLFCPFHGKIRHRQFRIHFSWPIRHDEPLYIAYIGPKITKS